MMKRVLCLLLCLSVIFGIFTGCGKEEDPTPGETQPGKEETDEPKLAHKATYAPFDLGGDYKLSYINGMCWSDGNILLSVQCETGTEPYIDEITGEPVLMENGQPMEITVFETLFFAMDPDTGALEELGYTMPQLPEGMLGYSNVGMLHPGQDGSVWFSEYQNTYFFDLPEDFDPETMDPYTYYTDNGTTISAVQVSVDGQLTRIPLTLPEEVYMGDLYFTPDGSIYGTDWSAIYVFDGEGNVTASYPLEYGLNNMFPVSDTEMAVTLWQEDQTMMHIIDPATGSLGEGVAIPGNAYWVRRGYGDVPYLFDTNGVLYSWDGVSEQGEPFFDWLTCDINSNFVGNNYVVDENGTIYALENAYDDKTGENTYSFIKVEPVDASTLPEKQILTLACLYLDWDLRNTIIEFNKSREDVRIEVKVYGEENYEAGVQKLNTEILSGVVPDLFYLDELLPVDVYAARGVLQDLWPLIDADPELSREDLMTHFFDEISVDGKLHQTVDSFSISTVMGRADVVGTPERWTLDDLMAVYATMPEGATIFGETDTKENILYNCLLRNSGSFIDWTSKSCRFDSQEFIDLLELVNSFPAEFDYENYDWSAYESEGVRLRARKQMLYQMNIGSFDSFMNMVYTCEGQPSFVGYPGTGSTFQFYSGLAISSECRNTDAAWAFIRQFLTEDYQTMEYRYRFPTNRHVFDDTIEQWMTVTYQTDFQTGEPIYDENGEPAKEIKTWCWFGEGEEYEIYEMTQAQYDMLLDLYEKTQGISRSNEDINTIIREECEAFFAGQKTAQETAALIQNRAGLYIFEQS